ncbi:MAG: hypothetical protein HYR56_24185 [Acidobacteria bacterium]|nr:hypothetical protein [Acidobacteriota bacterium]MBI3424312.1 hypothetical protein [Acidobacteriota bacterium]
MRNLLEARIGKEVDVVCEGGAVSGKIIRVEGSILVLEKEDRQGYVDIARIVAFWDKSEKKTKSAGFLPKTL